MIERPVRRSFFIGAFPRCLSTEEKPQRGRERLAPMCSILLKSFSSSTPLSYGSRLATMAYGLLLVIESWQLHVSSVAQVLTVLSVATLDSMHVLLIPAEA